MRTGVDMTGQGNSIHQWVRKAAEPLSLFDKRKEKETYCQARKELMGGDWIASTLIVPPLYDQPPIFNMPIIYDHMEKQIDKVSTLNKFLRICLYLMKDKS
jgi:hypothetical protein